MDQPQPRPQKPSPPCGSLTRAAWTSTGPPRGAVQGPLCLDWKMVVLPRCPLRGLSFVKAALLWRGEEGIDPLPQKRGPPPSPLENNAFCHQRPGDGERQQTEVEGLTWARPGWEGPFYTSPRKSPSSIARPRGLGEMSPKSQLWPEQGAYVLRPDTPPHRPPIPGTAGPCRPQTGSRTALGMWLEVSKGSRSCWGAKL